MVGISANSRCTTFNSELELWTSLNFVSTSLNRERISQEFRGEVCGPRDVTNGANPPWNFRWTVRDVVTRCTTSQISLHNFVQRGRFCAARPLMPTIAYHAHCQIGVQRFSNRELFYFFRMLQHQNFIVRCYNSQNWCGVNQSRKPNFGRR